MTILTGHVGAARHATRFGDRRTRHATETRGRTAVTVAAVLAAMLTGALGCGATLLFGLPGVAFAVATVAATAIWLIGAIGTTRTIRRQAPLSAAADGAAIAELHALLAREA